MIYYILVILSIVGLGYVIYKESQKWENFKQEYHCKIVSEMSSDMTLGVGSSGNGGMSVVVVPIPGKTGWLCDDGITYFR